MNLYWAGVLLLKVTLLFGAALCALTLMRRTTAQIRHLLCAVALTGALIVPLAAVYAPRRIAISIPLVFTASAVNAPSASASRSLFFWITVAWALGASVLLLRLLIGYARMHAALRIAQPVNIAAAAPVYAADVTVPMITGLFRPAILLPHSALSWPAAQLDAALRHELTHLERKDLWTSLAAQIACAVYWFHPLAWSLARRLRLEQETACDDAVLHSGFEATSYAEALVAAARYATSTPLLGCPMITRTSETSLKSRIAHLLDCGMPRASSPSTLRRAALVFCAALIAISMLNAGPQNESGHVYKMSDGITPPKVLAKVESVYSEEARAAKLSGAVLLSVVVAQDGMAHDVNVVKSLGMGLDERAVEAVQQWHFQPGTLNGQPVSVRAMIEINFKLL